MLSEDADGLLLLEECDAEPVQQNLRLMDNPETGLVGRALDNLLRIF